MSDYANNAQITLLRQSLTFFVLIEQNYRFTELELKITVHLPV